MQSIHSPKKRRPILSLRTDRGPKARKRILLSELSPIMARAVTSHLRREGYDVKVLLDGTEARWDLFSSHYDALIIGLDLPGSGGRDLVADAAGLQHPQPVIALTTKDQRSANQARALGATCVVGYGLKTDEITGALHHLLDPGLEIRHPSPGDQVQEC